MTLFGQVSSEYHGRFDLREDEAISVQPFGVVRVEPEELVEQDVCYRCHAPVMVVSKAGQPRSSEPSTGSKGGGRFPRASCQEHLHGGTRVTGVGLEDSIDLIVDEC